MTETQTTEIIDPQHNGMDPDAQAAVAAVAGQLPDVRPQLRAALDLALATARGVRADQLTGPTPCDEFDVDGLVRHLAAAADRAVLAADHSPVPQLEGFDGIAPADVVESLATTAAAFTTAWADDALLDRVVELEWATLPARVLLAIYLAEVSTHTWDVAVARGQQPTFDDAGLEIALATMRMGLPAEGRAEAPFGEVQPVADDATAIERLVAWNGRPPSWTAA